MVLARLGGAGGCGGLKNGSERSAVVGDGRGVVLGVACFRCCGWAVLAALVGVGGWLGFKSG